MMRNLGYLALVLAVLLAATAPAAAQQWGDLTGQFIFDGKAPAPAKITPNKDAQVCGKVPLIDESLVVDAATGGVVDVVLWLDAAKGKPAIHPDYAATAAGEVVMDNKDCRFEPRICLVRTTQQIIFGNKDSVAHNVKGEPRDDNPFNPLIPPNASFKTKIVVSQNLPVPVSCAIHPWMQGFVVAQDHPYMAVSGKDGKFTIKGVPAGTWTFVAWQSKSGFVKDVTVGGKAASWKRGRFEVTIKAGANDLGVIKVSPANFEGK